MADQLYQEVSELDEITFWLRQHSEHALFIAKGLQAGLQELTALGLENLIEEGFAISALFIELFNANQVAGENIHPTTVLHQHLNALEDYLNRVLALASQTWVGYNYPSQAFHYLKELNHLRQHIDGQVSQQEELDFWLDIHADHAGMFAHLLDPSQQEEFQQSLLYKQILTDLREDLPLAPEIQDFIQLTEVMEDLNDFTMSLREAQAIGQLKSVIHPRLALHVHREGLYSLVKLNQQ